MVRKFTPFFLLFLVISLLTPSCKKFEGGQTVPSYIRIDSLGLSCDYYTYGANTCDFTDVWVYVDDNAVGCFELPALVPVLKQGKHRVSIYPGIIRDGVKNYRPKYPFVAAAEYDDIVFEPGGELSLNPVFQYLPDGDNLHVRWVEDFDRGTVKMRPYEDTDDAVPILRVGGELAWHDPEGVHSTYSGKVTLRSDSLQFCIVDSEMFTDLPTDGAGACMLEMDYKCSDTISVGLVYNDYTPTQLTILRLRPTCASGEEPVEWKKIYINLGPYLVDYEDSEYFQLFISSWYNRNGGTQYFYFDNLKLLYLDTYNW